MHRGSTRCVSHESESARKRAGDHASANRLPCRRRYASLLNAGVPSVARSGATGKRSANSPAVRYVVMANPRAIAIASCDSPVASPSSTMRRCNDRSAVLMGCGSCAALITTRRSTRSGYRSANASATIPPYDAPTRACNRSTPAMFSTRASASAWSRVVHSVTGRPPSFSPPSRKSMPSTRARVAESGPASPASVAHHPARPRSSARTWRVAEMPPSAATTGAVVASSSVKRGRAPGIVSSESCNSMVNVVVLRTGWVMGMKKPRPQGEAGVHRPRVVAPSRCATQACVAARPSLLRENRPTSTFA